MAIMEAEDVSVRNDEHWMSDPMPVSHILAAQIDVKGV